MKNGEELCLVHMNQTPNTYVAGKIGSQKEETPKFEFSLSISFSRCKR